jgi:hypothetical protein
MTPSRPKKWSWSKAGEPTPNLICAIILLTSTPQKGEKGEILAIPDSNLFFRLNFCLTFVQING